MHLFSIALLAALFTVPDAGDPAPVLPLPEGVEETPWDSLVVDDCKARLEKVGYTGREYRFSTWNYIKTMKRRGEEPLRCHVPQPVVVMKMPSGMLLHGYTFVNCSMALAMARFDEIAQEEARRIWERGEDEVPVRAMAHMGTYNCRTLRFKTKQSQHSFGNGLDIATFSIVGAGEVDVAKHWTARWPALQKKADFLHAVSRRLREEAVFTNVLDPDSDHGHWNHIHVDLAPLSDGEPSPALARLRGIGGHTEGKSEHHPRPSQSDERAVVQNFWWFQR